jgi:NADH:ubiquinone oxidoreductase subunit 3 (subunit A)
VKRINAKIAPKIDAFMQFSFQDFVSAQFYMTELDRREKKRADQERDQIEAKRWKTDLRYERSIVMLIVFEIIVAILLAVWADSRQSQSVAKELETFQEIQRVLSDLQRSSAATADALLALQETSKQMNEAVQKELAVSYEVSLSVKYDIASERIVITNEGRTSVTLWWEKVGTSGVPYSIPGPEVSAGLTGAVRVGEERPPVPFVMFVKNERREEFMARYEFVGLKALGPLQIQPIMVSITPFDRSEKR